jgi:hypothetical protein
MTETLGEWERPGAGHSPQGDDLARRDALRRDLERLYSEVSRIETALEDPGAQPEGFPSRVVIIYHLLAGLLVGFVGAAGSLLFHVVGSLLISQHPLEIVRVYLTFPFGEQALRLHTGPLLATGVVLYLATGAVYGILFHAVLAGLFGRAPGVWRLLVVSGLGMMVWLVNYYLLMSWIQPLVTGGRSILDLVPVWLAATTHLIYAWTVVLVENRGRFGLPIRD